MDPDDEQLERLVLQTQAGDADARERLFACTLPLLRSWVRTRSPAELRAREAASDLVQSACREAIDHIDTFAPRAGATFRGWLFRIVGNKVLEKLRRAHADKRDVRRELRAADFDPDAIHGSFATPSQVLIGREQEQRLAQAIDALSEDQREVLLWSRFGGLPHKEIAARTGRSEVAVRALLSRALARLATSLERGDPAP